MDRPQLYAKFQDLQKTDNVFVLEKFFDISRWKIEGENALDIGCGDGRFLFEHLIPKLPKHFGKIVAGDCSQNMLEFAKSRYRTPKVDFVQIDIGSENIPEEFENQFHHIYSFYTLHWVKKQRRAFQNIFNMLKPGGDILMSFIAKSNLYDIYENMSKHKKWQHYSTKEYISPYHTLKNPEKYLRNLLRKIGFDIKVCKMVQRSFLFPNLEVFKNTISAVNPIIPKLPPDDVETYLEDFITEVENLKCVTIKNLNNNGEKTIREFHKIFIVVASKPL
ncbi:juvenile hormone acid O-methyltransferase-like [Diorhabda sublineata]|uniref:juvenile hormone acid O-methyltransferase-like n=1 Tax=Diorhabda sublineata TaxID=1163346 RepID=UPI0024E181C3|nr:juvenile hormone acid O-methyltransferase-like [Diorhabda sublineata]